MAPINVLHTRVLLPLLANERHQNLSRRLREFASYEQLSLEQNHDLQRKRLVRLLQYAYANTRFYRNRFDAVGFDPNRTFTAADVARIPALTRDDIKNHCAEMCSRKYESRELTVSATGGTTDTPVKFYRDKESLRDKTALQLCLNTWANMHPGDKVFHLWGARSDYAQSPSWRWRFYDRYIMRNFWAPTSLMNPEVNESYRQALNQFKPKVIYAYPTPLAIFCEHVLESRRPIHRPTAVVCTAEALLDDQRETIERVFDQKIFEHYGSREFGMIAAECKAHSGLHVATPAVYLEYIPLEYDENSEINELFVTDLLNYGMPLIRYRVNDCVVPATGQCACGRGFPRIQKIIGRTTDVFRLRDGSTVPGVALTNRVLQVCPGLKKMQVIQEELDRFRIRYVPDDGFNQNVFNLLRENLNKFFPQQVHWEFEKVLEIEREKSGKTRFCICKVGVNSDRTSALISRKLP